MDKTNEFTKEEIKMLKDACLVVISLMVGTKEEKDYRKLLNKIDKICIDRDRDAYVVSCIKQQGDKIDTTDTAFASYDKAKSYFDTLVENCKDSTPCNCIFEEQKDFFKIKSGKYQTVIQLKEKISL